MNLPLNIFIPGLEIAEDYGDPTFTSIFLNNLGLIYDDIEDYNKAIEFYEESLALIKDIDEYEQIDVLINLAITHQNKKEYDKAISLNNQALVISNNYSRYLVIC